MLKRMKKPNQNDKTKEDEGRHFSSFCFLFHHKAYVINLVHNLYE